MLGTASGVIAGRWDRERTVCPGCHPVRQESQAALRNRNPNWTSWLRPRHAFQPLRGYHRSGLTATEAAHLYPAGLPGMMKKQRALFGGPGSCSRARARTCKPSSALLGSVFGGTHATEYDAVCRSSSRKLHGVWAVVQFLHSGSMRSQRFLRRWHLLQDVLACAVVYGGGIRDLK